MRGVAVLLMLFSLACDRESSDDTATSNTMNPPIPQEIDQPSARPTVASPTQEVQLIEYAIRMPDALPAGRVAFNVQNAGKEDHGFEIEGGGVHQSTQVLKRGDTGALQVDL